MRKSSQKMSTLGNPASWVGLGEGENTPVANHPGQPWEPSEGRVKVQSVKGDMAGGALGFWGHPMFKRTRCKSNRKLEKIALLCSLIHPVHPHH